MDNKNGFIMMNRDEGETAYKALKHFMISIRTGADYEKARQLHKDLKQIFNFK